MTVCIFCREPRAPDEFSLEHVVPDAIGGTLTIRGAVCKRCNDRLGSEVDVHLTNHGMVELRRMTLRLAGKSGKVPNPFRSGRLAADGRRVRLDLKTDAVRVYTPPVVEIAPTESGFDVHVQIHEDDERKLPEIVNKAITRNGGKPLSEEEIRAAYVRSSTTNPITEHTLNWDFAQVHRPLLKIAYEVAYDTLGTAYLDDPTSHALVAAVWDPAPFDDQWPHAPHIRGAIQIVGTDDPIVPPRADDATTHRVDLLVVDRSVCVCVRIFDLFEAMIEVSQDASGYPNIAPRHDLVEVAAPRPRTRDDG